MRVWVALWTVYIVWGSTYLAIRYVVETMPGALRGARFFLAGLLFASCSSSAAASARCA